MSKVIVMATMVMGMFVGLADGFVWPSSGTVTVPSGETYVAAEADMANVNGLSGITFADATAKVSFTGSTPPAIPFSGLGTIEKDSDYDWTLTVAAGDAFRGTYVLKGGVVTPQVAAAFGCNSATNVSATLRVESGATLKLGDGTTGWNGKLLLKHTKVRITGTGKSSKGAIWVKTHQDTNLDDVKYIALDGDATVFADGGSMYFYHSGLLDLNGHDLTVSGNGAYYMQDLTVTGGGSFIYPDTYTSRTFCLRGAVDFVPKPDGTLTKVVMNGKQYIHYYQGGWGTAELMPPQRYELDVNGNEVTVQHNHQFVHVSPGEYADHALELAGPVKFKDASCSIRLFVSTSAGNSCSNCMLKVSGPISGPGSVVTHQYDGHTRVYLANPTNTFTGHLYCNGTGLASVALAASNSVPNYASVTGYFGRIALMVKNEDSPWKPDDILRFANSAVFKNSTYLSLDASESDVKAFTMPGSVWSRVSSENLRLSPDGNNVLTVTSPLDDRWYDFSSIDGTLRFTGAETIQIGSLSATMPDPDAHAQEAGTILIEDAADVHFTNKMVALGGGEGAKITANRRLGEMTIRNSKVTGYVSSSWATAADTSGIHAGWYGDGTVTIDGSSDVSAKFVLGAGNADSRGAVYQRGGTVAIQGVASYGKQNQGSFIGREGHGYYELGSGTCSIIHDLAIGGDSPACGIISILGGGAMALNAASPASSDAFVIGNGSGLAHLYIKNGTFRHNSYGYMGVKGYYRVAVTLDGPDARFESTTETSYLGKAYNGGTIHFNLNDGVMSTKYLNIDGTSSASYPCHVYFNFNGGTFEPLTSGNFTNKRTDGKGYFHYHLFAGGCTIDTGKVSGSTVQDQLLQATGSGVVSVPLPSAVASATLTGSPEVEISGGGGAGAQAYAEFDSTTRKVTGVRVICPGWDYTSAPTATFRMGSATLGSSTCAIAANGPGRLVKKGANRLTLNAASTYTGDTVLEGGTLAAGCEGAIPAGTRVVLAGGVMDGGAYTKPTRYAIDLAKVKATGAPVNYNSNLSFPAGSTLEILGGSVVGDDVRSVVLLKTGSGFTVSGTENVTISGVDAENWHCRWTASSLRMSRNSGLFIRIK